MASKEKTASPRRGSKLTLSLGLVNVPIKLAPMARSTAVSGRRVCPCHNEPVAGQSFCATDGTQVDDPETGFKYDGAFVTGIDRSEHYAPGDGQLTLTGRVDVETLDPLYFERTYLVWPQEGGESAHDLVAETLKASGEALIGTTVLTSSTRAVAIRWSDETSTLVAHVLSYDEAIAWDDVELVKSSIAGRPAPSKQQLEMAQQIIAGSLDELKGAEVIDGVVDEYAAGMNAAIEAAAKGKPAPKVKASAPAPPTDDIEAALAASLAAVKPKAKKKPAAKKKVAA